MDVGTPQADVWRQLDFTEDLFLEACCGAGEWT